MIIINIFNCYRVILINNDMKYHRNILPSASDVSYLIGLDNPCDNLLKQMHVVLWSVYYSTLRPQGGSEVPKSCWAYLKDLIKPWKMLKTASKILFLASVMIFWKSRFTSPPLFFNNYFSRFLIRPENCLPLSKISRSISIWRTFLSYSC